MRRMLNSGIKDMRTFKTYDEYFDEIIVDDKQIGGCTCRGGILCNKCYQKEEEYYK